MKLLSVGLLVSSVAIGCVNGAGTSPGGAGGATGGGGTTVTTGAGGSAATPTGGSGGGAAGSGAGGARADAATTDATDAGKGGAPGPSTDAGVGGRVDAGASDGARDTGGTAADTGSKVDAGGAVTIWLAGDSTVQTYASGNTEGDLGSSLEGWGQELAPFFNSSVTVNNQAIGGRSVAFFMWAVQRDTDGGYLCTDTQGDPQYQLDASGNHVDTSQWARIKAGIKAGDYLFIQFGTNDETHDCPRFVSLPDFESDLGVMADTVRAKGAIPIFVTPMGHRIFVGTTVNNTLLPYANAMKTEATTKSVEVLDLNLRSVEYYQSVGNTTFLASTIFDNGITHFMKAGAIEMAQLIVGEIRSKGGALATLLK